MVFGLGKPNIKKMERKKDVEGLIKALNYEKDCEIQMNATAALVRIGDVRAVEPLINVLEDGNRDFYLKYALVVWIGDFGDLRTVEPLIKFLKHENKDMRAFAAMSLGKIGDTRAVEPLIEVLEDENEGVQIAVAGALGRINGDSRGIDILINALKHEDEDTRNAAAESLSKIDDQRAAEALKTYESAI